jgi:hypothetical protein
MPRIALVVLGVLGGCSFEANYAGGVYPCSETDSKCPDGLVCDVNLDGLLVCREPRKDAAIDSPPGDGMPVDATTYALTCGSPYEFPTTGGEFSNTTELRSNKVAPTCFNSKMNGLDAVHVIRNPGAGKQMIVQIEANFAATAYVLSACMQTACNGNVYARPGVGNDISVYTLAGDHYIVVDSLTANAFGDYKLTISF